MNIYIVIVMQNLKILNHSCLPRPRNQTWSYNFVSLSIFLFSISSKILGVMLDDFLMLEV